MSGISIGDDLAGAARGLEERFRLLGVPARRVVEEEWEVVPAEQREFVPVWLKEILGDYALLGGGLEYRDRRAGYLRVFSFFGPEWYAREFGEDSPLVELFRDGFLAFADESNGNIWVTPPGSPGPGKIYLLELSAWDGGRPTAHNGLTFACDRLAFLLATMGISEVSYYAGPAGPHSLLWYKARDQT